MKLGGVAPVVHSIVNSQSHDNNYNYVNHLNMYLI